MIETKKRLTDEQRIKEIDAARATEQRDSGLLTPSECAILDLADANRYAQVSMVAGVAKVFGVECDTSHGDLRQHIAEVSQNIQNKYLNITLYVQRLEAALHDANIELADLARTELPQRMRDLSEEHWAAGWLDTTDTDLWAMCYEGRSPEWGMGVVPETALARLRVLAERIDAWYDGAKFIPISMWRAQRALRQAPEVVNESKG